MSRDPIYDSIKLQIQEDLLPVRPLAAAWRRALVEPVCCLLLALLVLGLTGLRSDHAAIGAGALSAVTLLQIGFSFVLAASALRLVIPGRLPALSLQLWLLLFSSLAFAGFSLLILERSPAPPPGDLAQRGHAVPCLLATVGLGLLPALAVFALGTRGLPVRPVWFGALCGLAAGLGGEAAWRLHCPIADPAHIFGAHGSAILVLSVIGLLAGEAWWRHSLSCRIRRGRDSLS